MLDRLRDRGIDEESVADQLALVISGKTVEKTYAVEDGTPVLRLIKERQSPKDMAAGAILYDALQDGALGISPRVLQATRPHQEIYGRFVPKVDARIIAIESTVSYPLDVITAPNEELIPEDSEQMSTIGDTLLMIAASSEAAPDGEESGPF